MKAVTLSLATLLLSSSAFAHNTFYGDILLGNTKQSAESTTEWEYQSSFERDTNTLPKQNSTSLGARLGYQFTDNFALELSHINFGEIDFINDEDKDFTLNEQLKTSANLVALNGSLPVTDNLALNATFGVAKWKLSAITTVDYVSDDIILSIDDKVASKGQSFTDKRDGSDTFISIGLKYDLTENIHLGLEYSMLEIGISEKVKDENGTLTTNGSYDLNSLLLVLGIKF